MNVQFTHPQYLLLLVPALAWVVWLAWKSDVQVSVWRRWVSFLVRMVIVLLVVLALAGMQHKKPLEGMNVFFLVDRSDSIPATQQERVKEIINRIFAGKKNADRGGVLVFGADAAIEFYPDHVAKLDKVQAVVPTDRTDIASAIRLGTAAFPESGQKRLVLISDGHENLGDALSAVLSSRPLGVTVDVLPIGAARGADVSVQRVGLPNNVKKGQAFEVKIFAQADQPETAVVRLYRNEQLLGEQNVELAAGKNLFTFPQKLEEPGFYSYDVVLETAGDRLPQNNRATGFANVRGDPRVLVVSANPAADEFLAGALRSGKLEVKLGGLDVFPANLAEMQSYDAIFLSNIAAGDLGRENMLLLESAVKEFGVGLVCVGGDQAYAAGSYRGTALENTLPVDMELSSKKVLPSGAVALVMHGMEFNNGNEIARQCALGVLDALGPQDEMGVVLWDGNERWLFPMTKTGDKKQLARQIAGMNQGDLPTFQGVMTMAHEGLKKSTASLKHMIVFSDGDPDAPSQALMQAIVGDKITVSTVLISGHAGPDRMIWIADHGRGRFYDVRSPDDLPQIFIKEAAVILKSAIFEEPFQPQLVAISEPVRGIPSGTYPPLRGYVCTNPKPRAEVPLVSEKGDPVLAHWQYGLGRAVAFTSDASAKWAAQWLTWDRFRQFWLQTAQWSLRKIENAEFTTDVAIERGEGRISVEAVDESGEYRNFLNLQTVVVSPKGEKQVVRLEQTGPGRYEAVFPARQTGAYLMNLMELRNGELQASQVLGASVNHSPEFSATGPNLNLLQRLAEAGGGKLLDPITDNPFLRDRIRTFQPRDLWPWLLQLAIVLFPLDVGVRRVQIDREEWLKATETLRRWLFFWKPAPRPESSDPSLAALLAKREEVRSRRPSQPVEPSPDLFRPEQPVTVTPEQRPESRVTPVVTAEPPKEPVQAAPEAATTTSRLLEAKRRARKKLD